LGIWPGGGMIGSIVVAFIGAVILVAITRLFKRAWKWIFDKWAIALVFR